MSEPYEYEQEAALDAFIEELKRDKAFIEQALEEVSVENIQTYLGTYGDSIEERVRGCLKQAEELHDLGYHGPSLSLSATAIEIIIRFFLLRPLVQGAFLSDEWAEILSKRIATGRTAEDRELLPVILRQWGIDITTVKLSDGKGLWELFLNMVRKKRDAFVHKGETVESSESSIGIDCVKKLMDEVVLPLAKKLDFTLESSGKWCEIYARFTGGKGKSYSPQNPFK